jgi:hypothetical protein
MELTSFYILSIVLGCLLITYPDQTIATLIAVGLKAQIYWINYRMKFMAWRIYRSLVKMAREHDMPSPGPFKYVDVWDRQR